MTFGMTCTIEGWNLILLLRIWSRLFIGREDLVKRNQIGFVVTLLSDQYRLLVRASQLIGVICDLVIILEGLALCQK